MKLYRVRIRRPNGKTEIIPVKFQTKEDAQSFADMMNAKSNGLSYELASCKYC